jgi:hypothetical protein
MTSLYIKKRFLIKLVSIFRMSLRYKVRFSQFIKRLDLNGYMLKKNFSKKLYVGGLSSFYLFKKIFNFDFFQNIVVTSSIIQKCNFNFLQLGKIKILKRQPIKINYFKRRYVKK